MNCGKCERDGLYICVHVHKKDANSGKVSGHVWVVVATLTNLLNTFGSGMEVSTDPYRHRDA